MLGNLLASDLHFVSHQGSLNAQDYSSFSHEDQDVPGKLLELGGIFSVKQARGRQNKVEMQRRSKTAS